jgi:hypothetical protein
MNKSSSKSIPETVVTAASSRRDFLKRTVAVSTVFAVPNILTKPVFGAATPNNRVNVGQIGCGGISNYHIGFLGGMPDVRIVAVADAYKSRREATAAKLNGQYGEKGTVKAHADFREILARPDVDAVIVAAHDNWHTPMSIAAANAGKDVYCQKPLGLDFGLTNVLRKVIRSGSSNSERRPVPWQGIGRWFNWFATATSGNSSGSTCGVATCRSTWTSIT